MTRLLLEMEKNPMWKGDNVGYTSLHNWVRRHKPKPLLCENCKKIPPYDLANISGKYLRDVNDFKWICRSCHMKEDGRGKIIYLSAPDNRGSKNGHSILNEKQVLEIKNLLEKGLSNKDIANRFKINRATIYDIKMKRRWRHIE